MQLPPKTYEQTCRSPVPGFAPATSTEIGSSQHRDPMCTAVRWFDLLRAVATIHTGSPRRMGSFDSENCSSISSCAEAENTAHIERNAKRGILSVTRLILCGPSLTGTD